MTLLFEVCFFLYFLKLSAGKGFWINAMSFIKNWVDSSIFPQVINVQKRTYETYV